jgi:hypothetical protein
MPSAPVPKAKSTPTTTVAEHPLLTVRFLVPGTRTRTAEDLGLGTSVIGNEEGSVVFNEGLLELVLGVLVDVFLVVGDY